MIDKTLLLSFPRSGRNWCLYSINYLSGLDNPKDEQTLKNIVDFDHIASHINLYNQNIFLIRNYKECLLRHYGYDIVKNISNFFKLDIPNSGIKPSAFINNIKSFEKFNGKKLLIYYENLIKYPKETINKIYNFLQFDNKDRLNDFLNNYEYHKQKSIELYNPDNDGSQSRGVDILFHSRNFTREILNQFDIYYENAYPELYKYIEQYKGKL